MKDLIKELVFLVVEKNHRSHISKREIEINITDVDLVLTIYNTIETTYYRRRFMLGTPHTCNQLQAAIAKLEEL